MKPDLNAWWVVVAPPTDSSGFRFVSHDDGFGIINEWSEHINVLLLTPVNTNKRFFADL